MSVEYWLTSLVVVLAPGAGVLYTMATGLARGSRASVTAAAGCTLGIVPHMVAAMSGVAALLHASAVAFSVLKYVGVVYLLYLAWTMARDTGMLSVGTEAPPRSAARVIITGVLVNILNPKLTIFFLAFLPQFVTPGAGATLAQMLQLSGGFMLLTFVVFVAYGALAGVVRRYVVSRPRVLTRLRQTFAGAFVVLAGRLALQQR